MRQHWLWLANVKIATRDQTFNCYVNIVLSVYIEWLSQEVKRTKVNLLVSSSDHE